MAIGISLYPEHASFERNAAYVERAAAHGCTRVFSCLLSAEGDRASLAGEFSALSRVCHDHGMEVVLDVAPAVFSRVGARPDDLSFFAEAGADGIRLDEGFGGPDVAAMTADPHCLVVELNASTADGSLEAALACGADKGRLQACHNFFPQRYTGLGLDFLVRESARAKDAGVRLAAFVSSSAPSAFGPWPGADGLPTLEMHRGLPVSFQARHLYALGLVDDLLVSNCFATDDELAALAAARPGTIGNGRIPRRWDRGPRIRSDRNNGDEARAMCSEPLQAGEAHGTVDVRSRTRVEMRAQTRRWTRCPGRDPGR